MDIPEIIDQMELEIRELEFQLFVHPYAATEDDYETVDGQRAYTVEYLADMPVDYNTMITRFGTLMELKGQLEESQAKSLIGRQERRWHIKFDE